MTKYKDLYYTIRKIKNADYPYTWTIRNKESEVMEVATKTFVTKEEARNDAHEHIDEYYY